MFPSAPPALDGVTHSDVTVGRHRWHVAVAGPEDAPPVVLLHGWPQHWWMWRHQIPELARTHRVYAPDLRGFGWSDAPAGKYGKAALAADVVALADALELETFDLVGHDWGGFVAFLVALRAPERVTRLVAFSIPHPWLGLGRNVGSTAATLGYQVPIATPGLGRRLVGSHALLSRLIRGGSPRADYTEETLRLYSGAQARPDHARAASALYRTFLLRELWPLIRGRYRRRTLPMPILLATGSAEIIVHPGRIAGLENHAPRGRTVIVEGAGHFLPEERPDEVMALIREGLDTQL